MNTNRKLTPRTAAALALAATLGFGLTACSQGASPAPASTAGSVVPVATSAPTASDGSSVAPVAAVTPAPVPSPTVTADSYSQVVNGVLFQGSADAPVRIGTDVPGQPPAVDTGNIPSAQVDQVAEAAGKYSVYIARSTKGGWFWKIFGIGQTGYWGELAHRGFGDTASYGSRQAAIDAPKVLDGRSLDRAEYVLNARP